MRRRDVIRTGLLAGAAGAAGLLPGSALTGSAPAAAAQRSGRAGAARAVRNVIFYAYDGMTWEDVALAQWYARRRLGRPLTLQRLLYGGGGNMETYSLTSVVTDSAAASSAWSTGRKIVNGMMNLYPDGTPLTTILDLARAQGRASGLVTTTRITHATPAAWIARVKNREEEDDIAEQYLAFRPDVLLGGGARHFLANVRGDGRDMFAEYARAGYAVLRTADELERTNASRVLGVFGNDHLPFEIDRTQQGAGGPPLARMADRALEVLSGAERGFVLQVEAGRIDHANHKNDVAGTLHDMLAADATLDVLMRYVDTHPDTLLLMASDHATAGGAVYGVGTFYRGASRALQRIDDHDASFDHIIARLRAADGRAAVIDIVRQHTGITLAPNQAEIVERALYDRLRAANPVAYADQPHNSLGHVLYGGGGGRHIDRLNVNYVSGQHTAGLVAVAAYGSGAATLRGRLVDNTELFGWMLDALGEHHENPILSERDALDMLESVGASRESADAPVYALHG